MGLSSFIKGIIINVSIFVLVITFMPGLLPDVWISKSYKIAKIPLNGVLAPKKTIDKMEFLYKEELLGPEGFADDKNYLYTSLQTGEVVKLSGKHIVPVVTFGEPCKGLFEERICGRPLGLNFGSDGYLYAADAYYGIFKVDVNTGHKTKLVSFGQEIDGRKIKLPNAVAVTCNGDVYWTDSSSNFLLQDGIFAFLDDPSGRLIHYNPKTGENKVLADGILFANGVALSKNEDFVIVADAKNQLLRHYLKGPKAGTTEIFLTLPGIPDNIQTDGRSGFLVTLYESSAENPNPLSIFARFPNIRRFIARSLSLAEIGFRFVDKLYPNDICQRTMHFIGHFTSVLGALPSRSAILHISEKGEILDSLWTDIKISEAHIIKNYLYLGSPFNDYIGRIPLSTIGWENLSRQSDSLTSKRQLCATLYGGTHKSGEPATPKQTTTTTPTQKTTTTTPKPTTTTPKPTTTTPKPTTTTPKPTTTTPKPTSTTPKPTSTTPKPTSTTSKPTAQTQKPTATTTKPTTQTQKPTTTTPKPTTATQKSKTTTPKPTAGTQKPTTSSSKPQVKTQNPTAAPATPSPTAKPAVIQKTVKARENIEKKLNEKIPTKPQGKNQKEKQPTPSSQKNEL